MKLKSKTKQNWVTSPVQCSGLDRIEQVNPLMTLPITGEVFNLFTLSYAINAGRQIGQCWFAKFLVPCKTHRRRVAKKGEGGIRYPADPSGNRFHTSILQTNGPACKNSQEN